ncbi:Imm7 family immunity protein [Nocardia asteroides]|uniref:Imm7 family immunity protein n=1 Tax=Nocardia asteroides TaxID=1824 RepID=UPI001E2BE500|nr:Imm7 family immunity protein [Nocardia asteroides]UGT60198.1 immunity 7 family protein [Nocardia asteroides]
MFEYHGWISLRSTAAATDDEPPLRLPEIEALIAEFAGYGLMDLRPMNVGYYLHMGGHPNHGAALRPRLVELFRRIGELAPGSYGLLHTQDDEDQEHPQDFLVYRMVRGVVTVEIDPHLSPVIPTLEDQWEHTP